MSSDAVSIGECGPVGPVPGAVFTFISVPAPRAQDSPIVLAETVGSGVSAWILIAAGLLLLIALGRLRGSA